MKQAASEQVTQCNVAVSGFYGFGNTGDEAIALAISRELKALGHAPLLLSQTPAQTAGLYGCSSAARMNPLALLRALAGSDVLLSGGGGLLQDKTSRRTLTYYLGVIRLARLLGKRPVVFNQSIGPLSEAGAKQVARALKGVRLIVRDRRSLDTLAGLNLKAELGGDPALLLRPTGGVQRGENVVVLAPRGDVPDATARLQALAGQLRSQGRRVVALSFYPHEDDAAAHSLGADEVVSTQQPQVALDTVAAAGVVAGVRLHALILAAAAGTPFVGLSYDPKVAGFCSDAGAVSLPTDVDTATLLPLLLERRAPDWNEVKAMQARARQSFTWALAK
ncbi:polysaccharide pyruvyl transferase CsaB [Deinococcus irradiatisoli]|uniref:Polysaccharide pyruvyl transferase CsaB n=1 Tax=Deinococcus irradiatisoli TaxID=2202254 RepID=A0A2Z3JBF1_9DEIO|nr:polysaccharide pyruvyl transferase CsaB [Deinococcus irradiatisoli]AWN22295.1 polysaccharide pyruvyl transferase CsaB [Deinococcus irradiatisoli]